MRTLAELLEAHRGVVVQDCLRIIDAEVADKSGISGLAVKAGFAVVKGVKPGFLDETVRDLLPEFAAALEPMIAEADTGGIAAPEHFLKNRSRVAEALLAITDAKAVRSPSAVVKGAYHRLRGAAQRNVEAAVPRLAELIGRYSKDPG